VTFSFGRKIADFLADIGTGGSVFGREGLDHSTKSSSSEMNALAQKRPTKRFMGCESSTNDAKERDLKMSTRFVPPGVNIAPGYLCCKKCFEAGKQSVHPENSYYLRTNGHRFSWCRDCQKEYQEGENARRQAQINLEKGQSVQISQDHLNRLLKMLGSLMSELSKITPSPKIA
jgi:hypothetical protein